VSFVRTLQRLPHNNTCHHVRYNSHIENNDLFTFRHFCCTWIPAIHGATHTHIYISLCMYVMRLYTICACNFTLCRICSLIFAWDTRGRVVWRVSPVHIYIPVMLYPRRGSRGISDIRPRRHFTKNYLYMRNNYHRPYYIAYLLKQVTPNRTAGYYTFFIILLSSFFLCILF
jgi:hypothetical protein